MRNLPCKICGAEALRAYAGSSGSPVETLCEAHYTEKHKLFELEPLSFSLCERCGKWNDTASLYWRNAMPREDIAQSLIHDKIKVHGKADTMDIKLKHIGTNFLATVGVVGSIPPAETTKKETKTVAVSVRKLKCPDCVKTLGNYHEAVIQVRGSDAERILSRIAKVSDDTLFIMERIKEGYNLRFLSKRDAIRVAGTLKNRFSIIKTSKMVGNKKGKLLYRDFYAVR